MTNAEGSDEMTMIVRFQSHVHLRLGEWLAAAIEASVGAFLFAVPGFFASDALFALMRQMFPQPIWAFAAFGMGSARIIALWINGRKSITPYIRMTMAFISCFVWYQFALGLLLSGKPALSLAIFPWLLALDVYNVFRASADAREVYDKKRAMRDGTGQAE